MKNKILFVLIFLIPISVFSQLGKIVCHLNNTDSMRVLGGAKVFLINNDVSVQETIINNLGEFQLDSIQPGDYELKIKTIGFGDQVSDSIKVFADSITALSLIYPFPCKFIYPNGKRPKCPFGHEDHIIPIVYGFPTEKTMKKAKKGLVVLGGCVMTNCDPLFFCKQHKKEL